MVLLLIVTPHTPLSVQEENFKLAIKQVLQMVTGGTYKTQIKL